MGTVLRGSTSGPKQITQPIKSRNEASRQQKCRVGIIALSSFFFLCSSTTLLIEQYWLLGFNATLRKLRVLSYCRNLFRSPSRLLGWWSRSYEASFLCQSGARFSKRRKLKERQIRRSLSLVIISWHPPRNVLQSGAFVKTGCFHNKHGHFSTSKLFLKFKSGNFGKTFSKCLSRETLVFSTGLSDLNQDLSLPPFHFGPLLDTIFTCRGVRWAVNRNNW